MSRRDQIRMTDDEVAAFLRGRHTMNIATLRADGTPHLVAMWYGFLGDAPAFWTYGKSQKILNLRRDPRITCLVEEGDDYSELIGVELVGRAEILDDRESVMTVGRSVFERHQGEVTDAVLPVIETVGAKRVAVRIDVERVVSWDHRKLGGRY